MVDAATMDLNIQAAELYRMGYVLRQIAEYQGRSEHTIQAAMVRLGVPRRPVGARAHSATPALSFLVRPRKLECVRCTILLAEGEHELCGWCERELRAGVRHRDGELPEAVIEGLLRESVVSG
jgi:hypothetical protein